MWMVNLEATGNLQLLNTLASQVEAFLKTEPLCFSDALTTLGAGHQIGDYKHLMQRVIQ